MGQSHCDTALSSPDFLHQTLEPHHPMLFENHRIEQSGSSHLEPSTSHSHPRNELAHKKLQLSPNPQSQHLKSSLSSPRLHQVDQELQEICGCFLSCFLCEY